MIVTTKEAQDFLNRKLGLPVGGWEQDWDIELAASDRLQEFLDFYKNNQLDSDQKFALFCLILSSFDDLLLEGDPDPSFSDQIVRIAGKDKDIHGPAIEYWSCEDAECEDEKFLITDFVRSLADKVGTPSSGL